MNIKAVAFLAMLGGAIPLSGASAMTISVPNGVTASQSLQLIDYKRNQDRKFYHKRKRHFTPGNRYNAAPKHWHRYHRRPGNWRTRGCIIVGPVWWCP